MRMTRRTALKSIAGLAGAGALMTIDCRRSQAATNEIVWGTNDAYAKPDLLEPFEKSTGVKVSTQLFSDPAEVVAKLKSGGAGVHILLDGSYHSRISYEMGVLKPIDEASVPNLQYVLPEFRDAGGLSFDGKRYGVPQDWGTDSVVYRHKEVGGEIDDIGALFDKQFSGRIGMPNGLFESLIAAAMYLKVPEPFAMNQSELDAVVDLLKKQKPMVRTYWNDIGDLKNLMATGEVIVAWGWQPVMDIRKDGIDVRWAHPKQGELAWYDASFLTIEADDKVKAECESFLNYLLGDFYGVQLGKDAGYRTTSTLSVEKMSPELRKQLDFDDPSAFLKKAVWWVAPKDPDAYQKAWDKVLNA
jgi:spermidine/putrescine-binding protein